MFGHLGDKLGRRFVLVVTLILMLPFSFELIRLAA